MKSFEADAFPRLGKRPIVDIAAAELLVVVRKVEERGAVETAHRLLLRPGMVPSKLNPEDILAFCRYLASISHLQEIYFLWRPRLRDPGDEMVFELAVAAHARYIVTHNVQDFRGASEFGVTPIRPADFLTLIKRLT